MLKAEKQTNSKYVNEKDVVPGNYLTLAISEHFATLLDVHSMALFNEKRRDFFWFLVSLVLKDERFFCLGDYTAEKIQSIIKTAIRSHVDGNVFKEKIEIKGIEKGIEEDVATINKLISLAMSDKGDQDKTGEEAEFMLEIAEALEEAYNFWSWIKGATSIPEQFGENSNPINIQPVLMIDLKKKILIMRNPIISVEEKKRALHEFLNKNHSVLSGSLPSEYHGFFMSVLLSGFEARKKELHCYKDWTDNFFSKYFAKPFGFGDENRWHKAVATSKDKWMRGEITYEQKKIVINFSWRAKNMSRAIVKMLGRPEFDAIKTVQDGAGLRIETSSEYIPAVMKAIIQVLKAEKKITITGIKSKNKYDSTSQLRKDLNIDDSIPVKIIINKYFSDIKIFGRYNGNSQNPNDMTVFNFEIQVISDDTSNEMGASHHSVYELRQLLPVFTRHLYEGMCPNLLRNLIYNACKNSEKDMNIEEENKINEHRLAVVKRFIEGLYVTIDGKRFGYKRKEINDPFFISNKDNIRSVNIEDLKNLFGDIPQFLSNQKLP